MPHLTIPSPVGRLTIIEQDGAIVSVSWRAPATADRPSGLLVSISKQINAYFAGERPDFDLPLAPAGTRHDTRVWAAMRGIPFGETRTYGQLAEALGSVPRAVGTACGRNPLPIVIPCHRVVASNGTLGGYSGGGGLDTKRFLLRLEAATSEPGPLFAAS